jgi:hypothetical protein
MEQQAFSAVTSTANEDTNIGNKISTDLTNNTKSITGEIKEIADNYLMVEAEIIDLSKLADVDFSKSNVQLPRINKTFKVMIDEKTELPVKKLSDLKMFGRKAIIETNELIYKVDEFTATKILILAKKQDGD